VRMSGIRQCRRRHGGNPDETHHDPLQSHVLLLLSDCQL
jgi:hypothetical protein